jgi:hypothetical protein
MSPVVIADKLAQKTCRRDGTTFPTSDVGEIGKIAA